jgi:tryptophanyl-tRNA synthetase
MAADVLAYKTTHVPVGDDQKQHLELARDIAGAFNNQYGQEFFTLPEPMILGEATRVMSLRDGTAKMSKSDISAYSRIEMMDYADTLALKVRKAKTDTEPLPCEVKELDSRPEALNLVTIYAALTNKTLDVATDELSGKQFSEFKSILTDVLVEKLTPIGNEMRKLLADEAYLLSVLSKGATYATSISQQTMKDLASLIGFVERV